MTYRELSLIISKLDDDQKEKDVWVHTGAWPPHRLIRQEDLEFEVEYNEEDGCFINYIPIQNIIRNTE